MASFTVSKSIAIDAPIEQVFAIIRDFRQWPAWSPWLLAEPGCDLKYAEDGSSYSWEGKIVGAGELTVVTEQPSASIDYRLSFFKPWKSENTSRFLLEEANGHTKVTWTLRGSLPLFMLFFKGLMSALVGMDYDRGLRMLKDYIERGSVPSTLEFQGEKTARGFCYVGVKSRCKMSEIGPHMGKVMQKLDAGMKAGGLEPSGAPFSLYHKWRINRGAAEFTTGYPVAALPSSVPGELVSGEVPTSKVYAVKHVGPYRHIGNAWSAGMTHGQAKVFAKDRRFEPYEVCLNGEEDIPEEDRVTIVHLGVKG